MALQAMHLEVKEVFIRNGTRTMVQKKGKQRDSNFQHAPRAYLI